MEGNRKAGVEKGGADLFGAEVHQKLQREVATLSSASTHIPLLFPRNRPSHGCL